MSDVEDTETGVARRFADLWQALGNDSVLIDSVRAALDGRRSHLTAPTEIIANSFHVDAMVHQSSRTQILRLRHRDLGTTYALKTLRSDLADNTVYADLLRAEARKHLPLRHPNILRAHTLLRLEDGRPALLLDWMDGGSLSRRLNLPISHDDVETIARALFRGVASIHHAGLIHADLTPANLLFATERPDSLHIADFDIAQSSDPMEAIHTQSHFAAAEVLAGQRPDVRSDLYACGRILELLLADKKENAASRFSSLARRLIHSDPDQRPQSALEVLAEL